MQKQIFLSLIFLLCSARVLVCCEPSEAQLDQTFGNAAQTNPGSGLSVIIPAGMTFFFPPASGFGAAGVYDVTTQSIISVAAEDDNSTLMITDNEGLITATVVVRFNDTDTRFADVALLTGSTTIVVGGNSDGVNATPTLLFYDQQANLLYSNTQAFAEIVGLKPMYAVAVVSTDTVVLAGQVAGNGFALAFYNYDAVVTRTVTTSFVGGSATAFVLAQLADTTIVAGGFADELLACARYTVNGDTLASNTYSVTDIFPSAIGGAIQSIVPYDANSFFAAGVVALTNTLGHPFLAQISNDLQTFTLLRVIPELLVPVGENYKVSIVDDGAGHLVMTTLVAGSPLTSTLIKLAYDGSYDTSFGSCRGSLNLPTVEVCFVAPNNPPLCLPVPLVGMFSIVQPDGKIVVIGSIQTEEDAFTPVNIRIIGSTVLLSTDPLTAAIQRKYFGITA